MFYYKQLVAVFRFDWYDSFASMTTMLYVVIAGAQLFESLLLDHDVAVNYCNW
jgi:hypothetical protein